MIATEVVNLTQEISCAAWREGARGVFLGRHGSEGAATGRRHRRSHRDGLVVARAPAAHRGYRARVAHRVRRQSQGGGRSLASEKIAQFAVLLQGAIAAYNKVGIMLNVRRENLAAVLQALPALKNPTISTLSDPDWVAVNTIVDEDVVRQIIPKLKAAQGAGNRGISAE